LRFTRALGHANVRCAIAEQIHNLKNGVPMKRILPALTLAIAASFPVLLVAPVFSQNDDATLRNLIDAAPKLRLQRTEFTLDPPLLLSSPSVNRQVSCVAVDQKGNVYLLQRGVTDPIIVADPSGKMLASWGHGPFKIPHSIRIDPAGNVWTTDAESSMIYKFTSQGKKLLEINVGGQPAVPPSRRNPLGVGGVVIAGQFIGTTDIAFASNGHVYVSDGYGNARVLEYDASGHKVREWGRPGTGPGEFHLPHGIAIGTDGNVYIADRENGRVQWFTPEGKYLGEWRYGGTVFSLVFGHNNDLYLGVRPKTAPTGAEGWVVKVDAKTGKVLGSVESAMHLIALAPDGSLLAGTSAGGVLTFRPSK
jgi:DNA-binding beta-propeller fold protein YncE